MRVDRKPPARYLRILLREEMIRGSPPGIYMDVSENSGTPKSSILIGFSIINHPFWGTPIFGNTHINLVNNGLNYQPQLVTRISEPSTVPCLGGGVNSWESKGTDTGYPPNANPCPEEIRPY